ncbi:MAG TPA: hypothetical protein VFQ60_03535 [Patescibacteria group bacterium]|nr:hypothetical protein [Patescibacteria group bacterium]
MTNSNPTETSTQEPTTTDNKETMSASEKAIAKVNETRAKGATLAIAKRIAEKYGIEVLIPEEAGQEGGPTFVEVEASLRELVDAIKATIARIAQIRERGGAFTERSLRGMSVADFVDYHDEVVAALDRATDPFAGIRNQLPASVEEKVVDQAAKAAEKRARMSRIGKKGAAALARKKVIAAEAAVVAAREVARPKPTAAKASRPQPLDWRRMHWGETAEELLAQVDYLRAECKKRGILVPDYDEEPVRVGKKKAKRLAKQNEASSPKPEAELDEATKMDNMRSEFSDRVAYIRTFESNAAIARRKEAEAKAAEEAAKAKAAEKPETNAPAPTPDALNTPADEAPKVVAAA